MEFKNERDRYLGLVGRFMLPLFPGRVRRLKREQFTLSEDGKKRSKLDHILRFGLLHQILGSGDLDQLADYHESYWKSEGAARYHESHEHIFEETFIPKFSYLVDFIEKRIEASELTFEILVEIGSGSGQLIDYLSEHMEGTVERFVGIDLSPETVAACNVQYGSDTVQFIAADGDAWIRENGRKNSIYISHRGVLEYFPTERLLSLFKHIAQTYAPTLLVTIEPVSLSFDLNDKNPTVPYSNEYSFAHNYPYLMRKAGFEILHTDIQPGTAQYNLLAVVAAAGLREVDLLDSADIAEDIPDTTVSNVDT